MRYNGLGCGVHDLQAILCGCCMNSDEQIRGVRPQCGRVSILSWGILNFNLVLFEVLDEMLRPFTQRLDLTKAPRACAQTHTHAHASLYICSDYGQILNQECGFCPLYGMRWVR